MPPIRYEGDIALGGGEAADPGLPGRLVQGLRTRFDHVEIAGGTISARASLRAYFLIAPPYPSPGHRLLVFRGGQLSLEDRGGRRFVHYRFSGGFGGWILPAWVIAATPLLAGDRGWVSGFATAAAIGAVAMALGYRLARRNARRWVEEQVRKASRT